MIEFRKAQDTDTESISLLVNSAYRGDSSKKGWTTEADFLGGQRTDPGEIAEMIADPEISIELGEENGQIIGCVYTRAQEHALYFGMLTVDPVLQNKGIGKLLLGHVEKMAQGQGLKKLRMTVISERKELIAYYERRGYHWTGKIEPFPEHDPKFGLPKRKLFFHEFEKVLSE